MCRGLSKIWFIAVIIVAVSIQTSMSIKCWRCSSDAANAQFCADPFEPNDTKFIYVECVDKESHKDNKRSVCKKAKKIVNGESVIVRSCHWERLGSLRNECFKDSKNNMTSSSITEFCETCDTDGCNGATQQFSNLFIVILSLSIVNKIIIIAF